MAFSCWLPLLLWINDGFMAVFFFLIGLEIKREILEGELSSLSQIILPGMGTFGSRVPTVLKVFLLTLAIFDDLAAIIIIAALALVGAVVMNRIGVTRISAYILVGVVLWIAVLRSGAYATLAGVLIAFCIPVAFAILPIFAFANAGLSLSGMSLDDLTHPVTLGVISGLLVGKPLGIIAFVGFAVGLRFVELPKDINWLQLLGVAFAFALLHISLPRST